MFFGHGCHGEKCCEGLTFGIENKGEELIVSIKGDKDKIAKVEKKLKAMKTLHCDDDDCC